jgi:hypothetical protein
MSAGLWSVHIVQWLLALVAFRIFMTWIYDETRSLPLAMLMHAGFTGGQSLLWPSVSPEEELVWYGAFAGALWIVVAIVIGLGRRASRAAAPMERASP